MREFHPVIRIVSFLILTAFLALGDAANILIGAAILSCLYVRVNGRGWHQAWRLLRRMRWLFLSIAVIYLWLTPGIPLFPITTDFAEWLPTVDGLWQGGLRIVALALMVVAASLLLHITARDQVLGALRWLLTPLSVVGFPHERFAVRAALTLEAVTRVQEQVRSELATFPETIKPLTRIGAVAAAVFGVVIREADVAPCESIELPAQHPPPLLQWGIPLMLCAVMTLTAHFHL